MIQSDPEKVSLEPFHRSHAVALFAALQDPALYAFIDDSPPTDLVAYTARCARLENTYAPNGHDRWLNWAVRLDDTIVGYVQATVYPTENAPTCAAEIAYALHSASLGRGIATRATQQMIEILERDLCVATIWVTIRNTNLRSIALAQRLGFSIVASAIYPYSNFAEDDVVLRKALP